MVMFGCKLLFFFLSLLANSDCQDTVAFVTNAGVGRYRISYNETSTGTVRVPPPPPGFFNISCLLNGQPATEISYSKTDNLDGTFEVDANTGALSLQDGATLDYETRINYQFGVRCAIPSGEFDIAQVDFRVLPVNEFEPVLGSPSLTVLANEMDPVGRVLASTIPEELGGNTRGLFSATDRDAGPDGRLMYSLTSENSSTFTVDINTGTLRVAEPLDVDDRPQGFFTQVIRLTVCDVNPPVDSCPSLQLNIIVFAANDNNPIFSQDVYQVTVKENVTLGSVITTVSCTDADAGIVGVFKNLTSPSDLLNITLGPESGEQTLSLIRQLDYETFRSYDIPLTCYDNGGLNATASLIITVEAVNDNPPEFSSSAYFLTMNRAETTGNEVGRVVATDADEDVGGDLTYTLNGNDNFQIQGDGTIILKDFVYVIEGETFILEAMVSDGEFSDTASVTITVSGVLSVPEIVLVCLGALIFLVLVIFIIILSCYCCVCCSRLIPKQRVIDVEREVIIPNTDAIDMGPMAMPMSLMGGGMFSQGKGGPTMIGQVPMMMAGWGSQSMEEEEEEESEDDHDFGSIATASSRVYSPTPYLKEMIDIFKDGDEVLDGKKSKKKKG